jgi:hypothetical protein
MDAAFGTRVEVDGLDEVTDLRGLLDRHLVVHLSPRTEMTRDAVDALARALGLPEGATVADLTVPPRPPSTRPPRPVSYIEELHHDGISDCSLQASFDSVGGPPNVWVDMRSAYRTLPADLRAVVDTGCAVHGHVPPPGTALADFPPLDRSRASTRPLRIRHPRSGEALLFLPRSPASVIEGRPDDEGRELLAALWKHTATVAERYEAHAGHNQLFVWDGLGTTHTNPPIPRAEGRRIWFTVIPAADRAVHPWADRSAVS